MAEDTPSNKVPLIMTILLLVFVLVAGSSYRAWLNQLSADKAKSKANALFEHEPKDFGDGLEMSLTIVGVDPSRGEMLLRAEWVGSGDVLSEDGTLKIPVSINVNASSGKSEFNFKPGEMLAPTDFNVALEGASFNYPDDTYTGSIEVITSSPVWAGKHGKDTPPDHFEVVELSTIGYAKAGGFSIEKEKALSDYFAKGAKEAEPGAYRASFKAKRSDLVVKFARLIMGLQWLLALSASAVTISVVIWKRKPELAMLTWMTAMLFALPPMRNIMVGAPPIGIYVDFLGFLLCEGIVAFCVASLVVTWIVRK